MRIAAPGAFKMSLLEKGICFGALSFLALIPFAEINVTLEKARNGR